MRRVLIVNPAASRVTPDRTEAVARALAAGGPVETVLTERTGHAAELAGEACSDCSAVYVFAGDGGFNEVVNGMTGSVPVGFLPGGATSVLPRALGLPRDPEAAARRIAAADRSRRISLGRIHTPGGDPGGRRFAFCAGIGLDAELVRAVDARGRANGRRAGDLAFVSELARIVARRRGRLEPVLEIEGQGRCAFVVVANCDPYTYAGPFAVHATPLAQFELGLDLVGVERLTLGGVARLCWWLLARPTHPGSRSIVYLHDAEGAAVHCDVPLPLQIDGEDLGDVEAVRFTAERDALSVLV